jgi:hypothetical protein
VVLFVVVIVVPGLKLREARLPKAKERAEGPLPGHRAAGADVSSYALKILSHHDDFQV